MRALHYRVNKRSSMFASCLHDRTTVSSGAGIELLNTCDCEFTRVTL